MNSEQERLLNLRRLPEFMSAEDMALLLGLEATEVSILASAGMLPVLGDAEGNEKKQFSPRAVQRILDRVPDWAHKARATIIAWHKRKNASRRKNKGNGNSASSIREPRPKITDRRPSGKGRADTRELALPISNSQRGNQGHFQSTVTAPSQRSHSTEEQNAPTG